MQQNNVAVNMANDECKSFYVGDARNMQYIHSNREIPTVVVGDLNEARAPLLRPGNGDATFSNDLRSNRPSATSLHSAESASVVRHQKTNQTIAELYDLQLQKSEGEWFETARWIKYEEDAEGVDRYWGQPHVSFLSFNSLMHLRRCFMKGILLLNLNAMSFTQISDRLSETLMANGVSMAMTKRIVDTLQLKHRYPQTAGIRRISTAASNLLSRRPSNTSNVIYSSADLLTVESTTSRRNESSGTKIVSILNRRSLSLQPAINENRSCSMTKNTELNVNHQKSCKRNSTDILHSNGETQSRRTPLPSVELAQVFAGTLPTLTKTIFVMIRLTEQTVFCETSEESTPVRFIFIIIGPENNDVCYHEIGRAVSTLMVNKHFNAIAYDADDRCALIKGIDQFLDDSVVIPPGEIDSKRLVSGDEIFKALKRRRKRKAAEKSEADSIQIAMNENGVKMKSGCKRMRRIPFGEMLDDIRSRLPYYWSDFRDALSFQCLTSVVFMFFASFAPAITFGGLMGKYTNEKLGVIETLMAQCICGIIWGLFAVQPLIIMSATGPVLIFEASLYAFSENLHIDFLTLRLYAGIWIMVISMLTVAFDGSQLLVYVTRFVEEIFATLISLIFIAESISFTYQTFVENPVEDYRYYENIHLGCNENQNSTNSSMTISETGDGLRKMRICGSAEPNTSLLTAIILFSTFIVAYALKQLRQSFYLGRTLRRAIGDFGVLIAIAFVALLAHLLIPDPYLARLDMPDHIGFTNISARGHGFLVSPYVPADQWWTILVALIAALLVFILFFVETEITELLLSRKERGLVKGIGMRWDLIIVGACALFCSILGLPWMCAAAVQSLAHCGSLTVMKKSAPGERPEVDYVIEQRITTIGVALLIGLIASAGSYLQLPLASLFGVFLYLGVMNLSGVQLSHRIILFFIPPKYFPITKYTENVSVWRMHLFTAIQISCLVIIYAVKYFKPTALAFPFILILFIYFRQSIMPRIFTEEELKALDGEEDSEEEKWIDDDYFGASPILV